MDREDEGLVVPSIESKDVYEDDPEERFYLVLLCLSHDFSSSNFLCPGLTCMA